MSLGGPELLIVLAIILLLFGGAKLPALARSLGRAQREFREGVNDPQDNKGSKGSADGGGPGAATDAAAVPDTPTATNETDG